MAKTANVLARVEPEIKEKAEAILSEIGVPASVVINMLYKQIIMTKSIPFSLSVSKRPVAFDELTADELNTMLQKGFDEATAGKSRPADEVFAQLRQELL